MTRAWLMLTTLDDRQHGGNEGYDDDAARYYSWDDTVANHGGPLKGDFIVLWDKHAMLGASVIQSISEMDTRKNRHRCPSCNRTNIKVRRQSKPKYRCHRRDCRAEFETPKVEVIDVHGYRSEHSNAWCDMPGRLDADELRSTCKHPKSMHSIREIDWSAFRTRLSDVGCKADVDMLEDTQIDVQHGFKRARLRVRRGQAAFRRRLRRLFGDVCAFSGPQPSQTLDAAHLYSYADEGRHHNHGGLMIRRDIHRLFDLGLLCVDPSITIDVHHDLNGYPTYQHLQGQPLAFPIGRGTTDWMKLHWEQHRSSDGTA